MLWRKWVIRCLVTCTLGGILLLGVGYRYFTHPEALRQQILDTLQEQVPPALISLDQAQLRLLGGVILRELRMSRRDDLDKNDFLYIPSTLLYHDKELLLQGKVRIRKVEIDRPRLRVLRTQDGRWNLEGLMGPANMRVRMPTIIVRRGTLILDDRQAVTGTLPLEIKNIQLTMINDPLPIVTFEGTGTSDVVGPVRVRGSWVRGGGPISVSLNLNGIEVGSNLVQRLASYIPEATLDPRGLTGKGTLQAEMHWDEKATPPLTYSVRGEVKDTTLSHPRLPWPLTELQAAFQLTNGQIPMVQLKARSGPIELEATLRDLSLQGNISSWSDVVREADLVARHVPINDNLFKQLPAELRKYQDEYSPSGMGSVRLAIRRTALNEWQKEWTLTSEGMSGVFEEFRYPVDKIKGTIRIRTTSMRPDSSLATVNTQAEEEASRIVIDLSGEAAGQMVWLKGAIDGPKSTAQLDLDLWGKNIPIDKSLLEALPPKTRKVADAFSPTGQLDFRVEIRRPRGVRGKADTRFILRLHEGSICYQIFPLPLNEVSATLDVRRDRWEFRDFVGKHEDGIIRASGRSQPMVVQSPTIVRVTAPPPEGATENNSGPEKISITLQGENLPLDAKFREALSAGRPTLARAWDTFALTGRMNFSARIDDLPNQPQDIDVTVGVGGCRMNPRFFLYPLEDVTATVRYVKNSVWLYDFKSRHGPTSLNIGRGRVYLPKEGGFWAELNPLQARQLVPDEDLLRALPAGARKAVQALRFRQPVDLNTLLIIKQPPESGVRPTIYWRGAASLVNVAFKAGLEWTGVTGQVSSEGLHNGENLEDVITNVYFEQASVLNQPLRKVHIPLTILKGSSDILRVPGFQARLFGGTVGGEARIEFGSIFRYELDLKASQVQLEEFGRHNLGNRSELTGLVTAGLHLQGEGTELEGMTGQGMVDVPDGKMYRLPLLIDLIKWLGLRFPDRTMFEQARVEFGIEGNRVKVSQLDLTGNAFSVRGLGTLNLDGTDLNLDLNADWSRIVWLLPPGINDLSREISNQLLRIKVRGKATDLRFEKELVPIVTDPIRRAWDGLGWGKKTP